ncbi:WXG100 family type VII secretion target [Streptomyces griseus]|uniref:WXG100 family type VII secretion target n=1 Tax=Streptomyces sp. CMC78 TaxID=3231512 RepID=A0AB33KF30_9ACTN|nr:WXG100 family type VII secretion target [Streptomyces sp. ID01-9D]WSV23024.1 WXG100 family type VII secretion target [Streptomyces fimicarius]WTC88068.1 WXG100 family type VII secretion target [Streptomyces griseus]WTD69308.1 WXG100 family type VII secretion target [Streptomyces griseus]
MTQPPNLAVSAADLTRLAGDLDEMQRHLDTQVRRMDAVVDRIESGWRGEAAKGYRALHRGAAEDAVRIREILKVLEAAMRMGRDGFTEQELDVLRAMRSVRSNVDVAAEAQRLSEGPQPHSRINDL